MRYNYIVIEGNIGSGKTSLATKISADYKARLILEQFSDNPFLPQFYENPEKFAFPLEMSFLGERFDQLKKQLTTDLFSPFIISDYFIDKCLVFSQINLQETEFNLYKKFFSIIYQQLQKPDIIVYLHQNIETLLNNISKRGRKYEINITKEYLESVNRNYLNYFKTNTKKCILMIDISAIDFVNNQKDYHNLVSLINQDYPIGVTRIIP